MRSRKNEPEQWIDVEWDPRTTRLFQAAINVTVENQRGVLAKVASEIADAGSNIDSITMGEDRTVFTAMHFVLEVSEPPAPRARHARAAPPPGRARRSRARANSYQVRRRLTVTPVRTV